MMKKKSENIKKPVEHYLKFDLGTDENIIAELVHDEQKLFPKDKIIVIIEDRKKELVESKLPPSKITSLYWVFARRKKGKYPKASNKSGKWLVFVEKTLIDAMWEKIRIATEVGLLGNESKVSTGKENKNATDSINGVICVYTYDYSDLEDVMKIRDELRKLGITNKIPYKTNNDTFENKYKKNGDKKISKYFE